MLFSKNYKKSISQIMNVFLYRCGIEQFPLQINGNCQSLKSQSFTSMKKITKKLSMKSKILLGKRKENSMKLILHKN